MVDDNTADSDERHLPRLTRLPSPGSPSSDLDALDSASGEGKVFLWVAIGAAVAWWLAAFAGMFALTGSAQLSALPPAALFAGAVALFIPGLLILMAGFLAKAHARASAANAVVLRAAARLLSPIETSGQEARTFADLMKTSAGEVDRAMAHALSSMKAMSGEISEERLRLETVAHEAAKQAGELSVRLSTEREALQSLGDDIRQQSEIMSDAIPRQAEKMRDSARQAASDIAEADEDLENRLGELRQASATLSERVSALDEMSVEATKRSESLIFAVSRMEEKLEQSRKMVDQALRASEMVAASASTTGDRITEAVSAAMENARSASQDIQAQARDAAEQAAQTLARLKRAGEEAAEVVHKARADAEALSRLNITTRPPQSEPAEHISADDQAENVFEETSERFDPAPAPKQTREETDSDLFCSGQESVSGYDETETDEPDEAGPASFAREASSPRPSWKDRIPPYLKPVGGSEAIDFEEEGEDEAAGDEAEAPASEPETPRRHAEETGRRERWSNILADVEREEDHPHLPREENAEEMIHRLMESGIRLTEIFRPRDKKKIASAARKGEGLRRKAVVDAASRQVQRVQKRLDSDEDLMMIAREFLSVEEADALSALDKTSNSSRNASARLSAFLLIDAALG
ncbi:MAG: hypothetical protein CME84_01870 [Henriciella sp.]|jgi:methyl-accepting chemotaxis protein|uniref:hypothetical protein n=1 Tax=Henriciella sp. TaxID=1968823 RepID=UPI000C0F0053|nr:hypothetical protein [Henriciella sp.]MAN72826.1 hypothetical protein [Henriciella sp.]PHR74825.1 MAG: hypothetical protein COA64_13870 [Henriciella sp.]|tara:strand:+ start:4389 stop:6317 length:1929 start_codon:yes stop_codon:yes gene_type:complete